MKTTLTFFSIVLIHSFLIAQCTNPSAMSTQDGNNINAMILNGGDLFWDGDDAYFIAPANDPIPKSTMFATGLWMGGFASNGQLKIAAQTYGRASGSFDYSPGPLNQDTTIAPAPCEYFNKVWKTTKADIDAHKSDFADNGIIDHQLESIFGWPGKGNDYFFGVHEFPLPSYSEKYAPFHDINGNDIYEPDLGEYPHSPRTVVGLTPASINWTIFNDSTTHTQTGGSPILAEVHLTSWSFDCSDNWELYNTVFTSHKIINRSSESIDSFHVSLWVDPDLGCFLDDYIGSSPDQNAFFSYNSDPLDGESSATDCQGVNTFGDHLPAQSIQFLNKKLDYFTFYNIRPFQGPNNTSVPESPQAYFNYMTGHWQDGEPLTYGGDAYNPSSSDIVNHVFPNNPSNPNGWSMEQENMANGDRRTIASYKHGTFSPNEIIRLDIAYTFHYQNSIPDRLEIVDRMYSDIDLVKHMYDCQFNDFCGFSTDTEDLILSPIEVFPNPSSGIFNLKTENIEIEKLKLYDISGRLVWQDEISFSSSKAINLKSLRPGIYILQVNSDQGISNSKIIIQ